MIPFELVDIFLSLQSAETREDGLNALGTYTHATGAHLFGRDEELGIFLPARGLPQTMRYAAQWQAFFTQCTVGICVSTLLPAPSNGEETCSSVVTDKQGLSILVLQGVELAQPISTQLLALLPLVGAKLAVERAAESAAAHAAVAREANRQAKSLNTALDANRQELQNAFVLLGHELTVRREAEDKLREADRKKDEFLAMLAHELRNPLAPISMAAQLMKLPSSGQLQMAQTSEIISRQVAHMTSLLDDLLDVSRVTRGKITLDKETVNAKAVIADAIEQFKPLVQLKQHQFNVSVIENDAYIYGDKTRLVQVIANILVNAAKYTRDGGTIDLHLDATDDDVVITVRDNGIGIESDLLPQIFELFTQAPRGSDRSQGGLGIGLALVKTLVELHGGSITARSQGADLGSEFTVRLPRLRRSLQVPQPSVKKIAADSEESLAIMVVDDNLDAANTLTAFLESFGHQVFTGYSARKAMDLTRAQNFDVIFLDIGLPDMDGYKLAKELKQLDGCERTVLIALTGYGQPQDKELASEAGFDIHLTKPADLLTLNRLLTEVAKNRSIGGQGRNPR